MKFNIDREVKILEEMKKIKGWWIWLDGEKFLPPVKWYRAVTFFTQDDVNKLHVLFPSWHYKNHSTIHHISSYFYGDYRRLCRNKASISLDLLVNIENQAFRQSVSWSRTHVSIHQDYWNIINTMWPSLSWNMQASLIFGK